ncbi:hypothetical protein D3C86_1617650 [compost metagenome]
MSKAAGLSGDSQFFPQFVKQRDDANVIIRCIGCGIDTNHGIAGPHEETVDRRGDDAAAVICWMIWLIPCGKSAGEPQGVSETRHDTALGRNCDHIL